MPTPPPAPSPPVADEDELKTLAAEMLSVNLEYVRNTAERLKDLDDAIGNASGIAGRCSVAQEIQQAASALNTLINARSNLLEQQTILMMTSVRPLQNMLQQIADEASTATATDTTQQNPDVSEYSADNYDMYDRTPDISVTDLENLLSQLEQQQDTEPNTEDDDDTPND